MTPSSPATGCWARCLQEPTAPDNTNPDCFAGVLRAPQPGQGPWVSGRGGWGGSQAGLQKIWFWDDLVKQTEEP